MIKDTFPDLIADALDDKTAKNRELTEADLNKLVNKKLSGCIWKTKLPTTA